MATKVKVLKDLVFPSDAAIRTRLRGGEDIPFEARGAFTEVTAGTVMTPPVDLVDSWIANGLAESSKAVADASPQIEEDDGNGN